MKHKDATGHKHVYGTQQFFKKHMESQSNDIRLYTTSLDLPLT